jgi:hypothetical protein
MDVAKRTRSGKWILFIGFHPRCWTSVSACITATCSRSETGAVL